MIGLAGGRAIFLATGTTDLRKSFTGLYALVREHLAQEPLSGAIFAFCNRRRDTVKLFCYDAGGSPAATQNPHLWPSQTPPVRVIE